MNKSLLMAITACAAMAMTSCSSEDLTGGTTQANETPISFSTYLGRNVESRAGEATLTTIQEKGFGVFAFYTGSSDFSEKNTTPNFMNNQKVEWKTNAWEYSPLKYWPNNTDDKVSFFAYAPYDASKSWSSNKIAYTVNNDVTKQVDLLFCEGQKDQTKQSVNDKITFNFKHALSRIGFSVAYAADQVAEGGTLDAKTTITINKVVLCKKKTTTDATGVFYTGGNLTLTAANVDAAWADKTGAQAFTLATDNFNSATLNSTTKKIDQLNNNDSYVMIIPQNTEFEVYVEYTVTTEDKSLTDNKSEIVNKITTPVSSIDFKAGTSYTLNLVLGMTSVKVEAEANDWATGTGTTTIVDAPKNTQN